LIQGLHQEKIGMNARRILSAALLFAISLAAGCTAKEDKQPQAPANAPKLQQKQPAGGGATPKGA